MRAEGWFNVYCSRCSAHSDEGAPTPRAAIENARTEGYRDVDRETLCPKCQDETGQGKSE